LALEPATGKTLFRFPFGKRGPTVNAATPLAFDGRVFPDRELRDWGGDETLGRVRVPLDAPADIWANDDSLSSQYSTPVHYQGNLYRHAWPADVGRAALRLRTRRRTAAPLPGRSKISGVAERDSGLLDDKLLIVGLQRSGDARQSLARPL
jgi:hypothetical protein